MPGPAKDPREFAIIMFLFYFRNFQEVKKSTETSTSEHFIAVQLANKQGLSVTVPDRLVSVTEKGFMISILLVSK